MPIIRDHEKQRLTFVRIKSSTGVGLVIVDARRRMRSEIRGWRSMEARAKTA